MHPQVGIRSPCVIQWSQEHTQVMETEGSNPPLLLPRHRGTVVPILHF